MKLNEVLVLAVIGMFNKKNQFIKSIYYYNKFEF